MLQLEWSCPPLSAGWCICLCGFNGSFDFVSANYVSFFCFCLRCWWRNKDFDCRSSFLFSPLSSLQCSASVFQCASVFKGCSVSVHRLHPLLLPSVHPCICTIPISRISDQPACISSSSLCISTLVLVHLLHTSASLAFVHLHRPTLLPPLLRKAKLTARFFLILLQQMKRSQPLC